MIHKMTISLILLWMIALCYLAACSSMADTPENPGASPEEAGQHISVEEESGENGDMEKQSILKGDEGKVLVVYYSWSKTQNA